MLLDRVEPEQMGKPVSVFACGVQKAGTTSLHAHLREHPGLSPPPVKEMHFFDQEMTDWSAPDYNRLESRYEPDDGDSLRFETTPSYIFWPGAIARIRAYNPAARLILLFRDPFDRAWSHWSMEHDKGTDTFAFAQALREEPERLANLPPFAPERRIFNYLERGRYAEQVRGLLEHFPDDQMLFLRSEDLKDDHAGVLARIAEFLDIDPFPPAAPRRERARPSLRHSPPPTQADRAFVAGLLRQEMQAFALLTGLDVSHWTVMTIDVAAGSLPPSHTVTK